MTDKRRTLVIDFETKDPYISKGYGAGWVFALNHDMEDFKLLGMGVWDSATGKTEYIQDSESIKKILTDNIDVLVMHNGMYDLGCIKVLFKDAPEECDKLFESVCIHDTMIMAKLHTQKLHNYRLDSLCKEFRLESIKQSNLLADYGYDSGLYAQIHAEETGRQTHTRPSDTQILKKIMPNLDLLDPEVVGEYCLYDVEATKELWEFLSEKLENYSEVFYSDLLLTTLAIRCRGVKIDLAQAREVQRELQNKVDRFLDEVSVEFGMDLNIYSPYQLAEYLEMLGIDNYPRTTLGNPSIKNEYLDTVDNPWVGKLREARLAGKLNNSFIQKMINYQGFNNNINGKVGVMYTSLKILGTKTGRFTSGGGAKTFELNIQQIPNAGTELGKLCRSMFIPDEGEKWISADFSNQEPRIQVHYGEQLKCQGATKIADSWREDPTISFHEKVAEFTGLSKKEAKTINLGLAYGMGAGKLCDKLGLPYTVDTFTGDDGSVIEYYVAGEEGQAVLDQYNRMVPFMGQLTDTVNSFFKYNKMIKTLGGRVMSKAYACRKGCRKGCTACRKGFNKLIQGSAADQTMQALIDCHKAGLKIINTVHDEINITSSDPEKDAKILKDCMENALPVSVPMVAEVVIADNWAEAK